MNNQIFNKYELLVLLDKDQENIKLFMSGRIDKEEFIRISTEITKELRLYIETKGFPFKNKEPYEVYKAAFALSLHADPKFLKQIGNVFSNTSNDQVDSDHKAYFIDKLRLNDGELQLYGTQFKRLQNGLIEFFPIEDYANVNFRRKKIGLSTLEEYKKIAERG